MLAKSCLTSHGHPVAGSRSFAIMEMIFWSCSSVSNMPARLAKLNDAENEIRHHRELPSMTAHFQTLCEISSAGVGAY